MGKFILNGPGTAAFLNYTLTNDVHRLEVGQAQYSLMCNERGGIIDDLYVYRLRKTEYLLIVNAARCRVDYDWLETQIDNAPIQDDLTIQDRTKQWAALALQGPLVRSWLGQFLPEGSISGAVVASPTELKKNECAAFLFEGEPIWISCTGYTGEDGFELVGPPSVIRQIAEQLLERFQPEGLQPAGLGARDTLRLEMGYPLYGHELDEETTPLEAGLGFFVRFEKGDFIGRAAMEQQKAQGLPKKAIALRMEGRTPPPRQGCEVVAATEPKTIGQLTSGTISPSLGVGIGLGYVQPEFAQVDSPVRVRIRDRLYPARIVRRPIYRKK